MKLLAVKLACICFTIAPLSAHSPQPAHSPRWPLGLREKYAYEVSEIVFRDISARYSVKPVSYSLIRASEDEELIRLIFGFDAARSLTVDDFRELMFAISDDIVTIINEHEDVQPYLVYPPTDRNNVIVYLYPQYQRNVQIYAPFAFEGYTLNNDFVCILIDNENSENKVRIQESFEEAIAKIEAHKAKEGN